MKEFGYNRQQLRANIRARVSDDMRQRYCGQGWDGNRQWPEEFMPRSRRRSIMREAARRVWRQKLVPKQEVVFPTTDPGSYGTTE